MKKPKHETGESSYLGHSKEELIKALNNSYLEYNSLKEAFTKINSKLSQSQQELDITAMKLKACEDQFHNIFDNMFNGILVADILMDQEGKPYDHRFVRANKVSEKLTGFSPEKIIGKSSKDLNIDWPQELLNQLFQVTRTGKPIEYERYNERLKKHFHTQVFSPSPKQLAFVFDDITDRKNAEMELISAKEKAEENELRFKAISEQSMDGISLTDIKGNYVFVNPVYCKITGYSEAELLKMNVFDVITEDALLFDHIKNRQQYPAVRARKKLIRKDGSLIYGDINIKLINVNNEEFVLGIVRDTTDQMKAEKELIVAKERAEVSDKLKTAFLMNLSHEIRTPMNAILGFLELLKEPNLNEGQKHEYIGIVNTSSERLLDTINDIIEISRIDSGEEEVIYEDINLSDLIKFHCEYYRREIESRGVKLIMSQPFGKTPEVVISDRKMLNSILSNLIKNAVKFTEKGSIEIGNYTQQDNIVLFVKDTGIGIPSNRREIIFDRFVQADMSITRAHEGTGLGLAIVKAHVKALGGNIRLQSEINKGSTFYVTLPIPKEKTRTGEHGSSDLPSEIKIPDNVTVLIAEDDELSYQYYEILLSPYVKLMRASNGAETVKAIEENSDIALILMDIKMPGEMNGLDATRYIRKLNSKIPIIAQTAYALEVDRTKALEAGCSDYVTKPINKNRLLALIAKHCPSGKRS